MRSMTPSAGPSAEPVERPLRRDAERNRRRILEAAAEVFAERGLSASLDDVARRAEVGVGTVYRRFPDKQLLVDALFEDRISEVVEVLERGLRHPDPWEGLVTSLETLFGYQACDRGLMDLVGAGGHGSSRCSEPVERIRPVMERLLRRAQEDGSVRADLDASDIPILQIGIAAVIDATRDIDPELWKRSLAITLDGLRARRDGPSPLPADAIAPERIREALESQGRRR